MNHDDSRTRTLARFLAVAGVVALFAAATTPAHAGDTHKGCLEAEEAVAAGDDEGPPKFSPAFFGVTFTVDVSTDGFGKRNLAISIEEVCDVPAAYAKQAAQLAETDGVAIVTSRTRVYKGRKLLKGKRRRNALGNADTMRLSVNLLPPQSWRRGEDDRLPTFRTLSATITD